MDFSVVIPAYNEEENIKELVERVKRVEIGGKKEIIVVDDGSTDRTAEIAKKIKGIKFIAYQPNKGKPVALRTGIAAAKTNVVLTIDSDLNHVPEEMPRLVAMFETGNYDLVVGSRFLTDRFSDVPFMRRFLNIFGSNLVSILIWAKITDATCGYRIFKKELINLPVKALGLDFEVEFTVRAIRAGCKYKEVPVSWAERGGASKLKVFRDTARFFYASLRGFDLWK